VFDSAKRPGGKGIVPNVEMSTASGTENHLCFPAKVIILVTGRLFRFLITWPYITSMHRQMGLVSKNVTCSLVKVLGASIVCH
jgi:hypothetical protein